MKLIALLTVISGFGVSPKSNHLYLASIRSVRSLGSGSVGSTNVIDDPLVISGQLHFALEPSSFIDPYYRPRNYHFLFSSQDTLHDRQSSIGAEISRTATNENGKVARLDHIFHALVPQTNVSHIEWDTDSSRLAGLDKHLFETLELDVGYCNTSDLIFDVQLDDLGSIISAIVGDRDCSGDVVDR